MATVTLYPPKGDAKSYEATSFIIDKTTGVLTFISGQTRYRTSVPFTVSDTPPKKMLPPGPQASARPDGA